jgi:hypothetical protein
MNRILKFPGFIFFIFTIPTKANCQYIKVPGEPIQPNHIFITVGAEPEIVTTLGYVHSVGQKNNPVNFQLGGSIKLAPLIVSNGAWRANFISTAGCKLGGKWTNTLVANIYLAHDHNREGTFNGLGFEIRDNPVFSGKRWTKGFDVGWQYTPYTHIKHSAEAKETFNDRYPDGVTGVEGPKDGWYKNAASRLRVGITGATRIGRDAALQISLGSLFNIQKQGILLSFSHAQVPAYLEVGYRRYW